MSYYMASPSSRLDLAQPLPNRLVGDRHASLREEIFGIAEAEAEPMVEPDRVADDVGRESIGCRSEIDAHQAALRGWKGKTLSTGVTSVR